MKKTKKTIKQKKDDISISLKLLGRFYNSKGKTLEEAIDNLKVPINKGMGVLVIQKGGIKKERILNGRIIGGLFGKNPTMKGLAIKNLNNLIGF